MARVLGMMVALMALASVGCGGGLASPSDFSTEVFTGTLAVGGSSTHQFAVVRNGEVNVTVRQVLPTVTFGAVIGQVSGGQCLYNAAAGQFVTQGSQMNGQLTPGSYCVVVFDVGVLPSSISYTLAVTHS